MLNKLQTFISDLLTVSKLTRTRHKKVKIAALALVLNLLIFFDILIILFFSKLFAEDIGVSNQFIDIILSNNILFPIAIFLRFFLNYLQIWLTTKLQLDIENNLRVHLLGEIFKKGNYSISDAYFYVNTINLLNTNSYDNIPRKRAPIVIVKLSLNNEPHKPNLADFCPS